jgi:DNA repair protein RecN (Recombination protein N)
LKKQKQKSLKIKKVTSQSGKSSIYIDDKISNQKAIKSIFKFIELTGQHANLSLLKKSYQIEVFDSFSKNIDLKKSYQKAFDQYKGCIQKLSDLNSNLKDINNRKEILQDLLKIIDNENFYTGEIAKLLEERDMLKQNELVNEKLQKISEIVSYPSSLYDYLSSLSIEIKSLSNYEQFNDLSDSFMNLKSSYETFCEQVEAKIQKLPDFADRFLHIQDRLAAAEKIRRILKLQEISQIETAKDDIKLEINKIFDLEEERKLLELNLENYKKEVITLSDDLSKKRADNIDIFSQSVENELKELDIPNAKFKVIFNEPSGDIIINDKSFSRYGAEEIEFYFSANPEIPLETLDKVASGGELSRIMLALELLNNDRNKKTKTFIFDEIDSGIGGFAAVKLREKLLELSNCNQIFIITHQANLAACADLHYKIIKEQKDDVTHVMVKALYEDERLEELSRMLSGNISEYGLKHAKELLK